MTPAEVATSVANLKLERDAIVLYENLAQLEKDPRRAAAFRKIAANERRHADIWAHRLREAGAHTPDADRPRMRVRIIIQAARLFGTRAVSEMVQALEAEEEDVYTEQSSPEVASIAADEREHAEIWRQLDVEAGQGNSGPATASAVMAEPSSVRGAAPIGAAPHAAAGATTRLGPRTRDLRDETWHRAGRTGTLRAAIFGVNDGLVSNLSLVMGVTGANVDNEIVVLAGVAGLLAGAFSMGAGEWISMQSQRELFERQISIEREELRIMPDVEQDELTEIYRSKGVPDEDARRVARGLMRNPEAALDTKVREELGLDPDELGSPWGAAAGSFVAFGAGAFVPLLPFLLTRGMPAFVGALVLAFSALFLVGAGVSLLTGRNVLFSALRQVAIGAGAAAVTYAAGSVVGVQAGA